MQLCQLKIDELNTKSYEDEYEAEVFAEFKKSAWLNVYPSTEKFEKDSVEYTSKGMRTE